MSTFSKFTETYLKHTRSRWANQPFVLEPWQKGWTDELLSLRPDGSRKYQQALLGIARGNGKSSLLSALCLYALIVEGMKEPGAEVYALAASKDQGRIIFNESKKMLEESILVDYAKIYRDSIYIPHTGAVFQVLASDAPKLHGKSPWFFVGDEVHAFEDRELWDVMSTAQIKRPGSLGVGISTAGFNLNSVLGDLYQRGKKGEEGFYFKWFEASDVDDADTWKEANPSSWITKEDLVRESKRHPRPVFQRLHLNRWTKAEEAWLPSGMWEDCEDTSLTIEPGEEVWVGIDLGYMNDPTAIVEVCPKEDRFVVRAHIYAESDAHYLNDEDTQSYHQILDKLLEIGTKQQVNEFVFDPNGAYLMMEELMSQGYNVVSYPQTALRMCKATDILYQLIDQKMIAHNGDPFLANHIQAAHAKWVGEGLRLHKDKKRSPMDAAIALALATVRAQETGSNQGFSFIFFDPNAPLEKVA